jgi:hypothetical protein
MLMTPFEQELGLKMNPGEAFVETSLAVPAHDHLVIGDEVMGLYFPALTRNGR